MNKNSITQTFIEDLEFTLNDSSIKEAFGKIDTIRPSQIRNSVKN